ncbi:hypothetical protein AWJ20_2384 [Sugiyamaella lignohabitans]|uniref:EF-hand domain-containing protein n=1 Tax=Sugiyamaella lignohabitans TaxID=796027 RepID=A0A161HMA7_9ASCO|nr:uncharacterized protein AWJ20_2384 [Sugiyamaella lignohabitans]ANB14777.1 hypothetical protein AWJ20_2384 [Sugiyamaella lignohabitans]
MSSDHNQTPNAGYSTPPLATAGAGVGNNSPRSIPRRAVSTETADSYHRKLYQQALPEPGQEPYHQEVSSPSQYDQHHQYQDHYQQIQNQSQGHGQQLQGPPTEQSLPNIPPSAHLAPRPVPPLALNTKHSPTSPTTATSVGVAHTEAPPSSPFTSGPTAEAAGLLPGSGANGGADLRPHRSMRSMFSRRGRDDNSSLHVTSPQIQVQPAHEDSQLHDQEKQPSSASLHPTTSIFSRKEIERHLPILMEESDSDEEMPDIKQVVSQMEHGEDRSDESGDTSRASTPDGDGDGDHRKRRGHRSKRSKRSQKKRSQTPSKFVTSMRKFYVSIISKTLITRAFIYWLPLGLILFVPLAVGAWGNPDASVGHSSLMWLFIWLEVVWGSLWISRIVAHYLPSIMGVFLGIVSPSMRKYTAILAALELPVTLVFWAFVSFITFIPLLSLNHKALKDATLTQPWQRTVNNIMVALLISSLIFLAERLFIHLLSVSFHKTRFASRIKNNKQAVSTLSLLLQAAYQVFPQFCEEFEDEDMALEGGALLEKGKKMKAFQAIAGNENMQKVVGTVHRVVGSAANVIGNVARDFRGSRSRQSSAYKVVSDALESRVMSEILASRIWKSLVLEDSESLTIEDLLEVIGTEYEDEARTLFDSLDKDSNGDLTLAEIIASVKDISRERKTIYRSLRDMDSAIGKLHSVLLFVVFIIIIIVFIGMLAPSVGTVLATLGSTLLALSFVFSVTAQEILASCVFLFVKHPLDVGDIVTIALNGVNSTMSVSEISLLYTVLKDTSTGVVRQAPNAVLNTLWIDNTTRSGPMSTPFTFTLGLPETSAEDIEVFKDRLNQFLAENHRDYMPNPYVQITNYEDLDRIALTVSVTYRNNFADGTLLGNRRTKLLKFFAECVNSIPLHIPRRADTFSNPDLPMFSNGSPPNENTKFTGGLRTRQAFGIRPVDPPTESDNGNTLDEKNDNVFTDGPLSARDQAMQDVAMAHNADRTASTTSRATTTGINRSTSRGLRRRI